MPSAICESLHAGQKEWAWESHACGKTSQYSTTCPLIDRQAVYNLHIITPGC